MTRKRERSLRDEKAGYERLEPRGDKTPQRGEPERSSTVTPAAQDPSPQADRDRSLQDVSRSQQATNPAAVRNRERDTGPSR